MEYNLEFTGWGQELGSINIGYNETDPITININPNEFGNIYAHTDASSYGWNDVWIPDSTLNLGDDGKDWQVILTPRDNDEEYERYITITFESIGGEKDASTFTIIQDAKPVDNSKLSVSPTSINDTSGMGLTQDIIVTATGGTGNVTYTQTANTSSWLKITKKNTNTYTVTLTKNEGWAERNASITFSYGSKYVNVDVSQAVPPDVEFSLSSPHTVEGKAGRFSISVDGPRSDWAISTASADSNQPNWLVISDCSEGARGANDFEWSIGKTGNDGGKVSSFTIDLSYDENIRSSNRTAVLYVNDAEFTVIQEPVVSRTFLDESDSAVNFDHNTGTKNITLYVTGDAELKVTIPDKNDAMQSNDWLQVDSLGSKVWDSANNCYKYTPTISVVDANDDLYAETRSAVITFTYGTTLENLKEVDVEWNVTVSQSAKDDWRGVQITPGSQSVPAEGGSGYTISATSDTFTGGTSAGRWEYNCTADWIHITTPTEAELTTRNITFKYSVDDNIGNGTTLKGPARTGTITINDNSGWSNAKVFEVKQEAGNGIAVNIDTDLNFSDEGGSKTATVTVVPSGASYTVDALIPNGSSKLDWVSTSISGNKVTITATKNESTTARTGRLVFKSGKASVEKAGLSQGGKKIYSFSVSPTSHTFNALGSSVWCDLTFNGTNVEMTANNVSVKNKPSWITASGVGSSRFELAASTNEASGNNISEATLTASNTAISVASTAGTTSIPLTYSAKSNSRSGSVELVYGSNLATATISVSQNGDNDTDTNKPTIGTIVGGEWISAKINGPDLEITVKANEGSTSTSSRSGSVQVNYCGKSTTISVTQVGKDVIPDSISVSPTSKSFGVGGGKSTHTITTAGTVAHTVNVTNNSGGWVTHSLSGNTITLNAAANTGGARNTTIALKYGDATATISVSQDAYVAPEPDEPEPTPDSISVSPSSANFNEYGGKTTHTLTVSGTATVEVINNSDWISVSPITGDTITLTVDKNNSTSSRSGSITLKYGTAEATISVAQSGKTPTPSTTMTADPRRLEFDWKGGKLKSTITIN